MDKNGPTTLHSRKFINNQAYLPAVFWVVTDADTPQPTASDTQLIWAEYWAQEKEVQYWQWWASPPLGGREAGASPTGNFLGPSRGKFLKEPLVKTGSTCE